VQALPGDDWVIRELKTFVSVAREGTFTAAAEKIGLTQAAVSAQMQRLEAELGIALFDRTGRSAQINEMGLQTLTQVQELIRLYGNLGSPLPEQPTTLVSVGAIASAQRSLIPTALARFHAHFDGCRTRVVPGLSLQLATGVDSGELDMAVIIRPAFGLQSDLRWTTLAREPFRLIAPRNVKGDDWMELLATQPFVRYDRASYGGRQVDRFLRAMHMQVQEICEVDELDAMIQLVARGLGVAIVPQTVSQRRWPAGVRAIDLGHHTFHRDIGLIHRTGNALSETARTMAMLICTTYRAIK
jgi:DNA-binding transcriptional LysR family regulator